MKTPFLRLSLEVITVALFLLVSGCKKNNNVADGEITPGNVGRWTLSSFQLSPADNGRTDLKAYYNGIVGQQANCYAGIVYNFNSDGTIALIYPSTGCTQGSTFTFFDNGAKWSVNGNNLIVSGVRRRTFNITNSSANAMTLEYQSTGQEAGQKTTYTYTATFNK